MKYARLFLVFALLISLFIPAPTQAAETDSTPVALQPRWTTGSSWFYKGQAKSVISRIHRIDRVETINGVEYYVMNIVGYPSGRLLWVEYYTKTLAFAFSKDSEGNIVLRSIPPSVGFNWPLSLGKKWSQELTQTRADGRSDTYTNTYEVVAYEKVRTKADEFEAFKITRRVVGRKTWIDLWYAPAVQNIVKVDAVFSWGTEFYELVNYEIK